MPDATAQTLTANCVYLTKSALQSYWATALWSSTDEDSEPLDSGRDMDDVDPKAIQESVTECDDFLQLLQKEFLLDPALGYQNLDQIMHDFWLTRNGHGAGFWDGDYGYELGRRLTEWAKTYGSVDLYVGDDGLIYAT